MIRGSVLYPNKAGARFDHAYYAQKHFSLVKDRLGPLGLVRCEVDRGIAGRSPDTPAPYIAAGHLIFNSILEFQAAYSKVGHELMADIPNYTDIGPELQISDILLG
jgi:uncharacterized protein (TIGR02118 family)